MKTQPVALSIEIAGTEPPEEFRIFAMGTVSTTKGDFLFDQQAAASVIAWAKAWGNRYSLDYGHQVLEAGPAPAAGWFDLELRADGLWAVNVEWTARAAEFIRNREYRYISPLFHFGGEERRISDVVNVALTNVPAIKHLEPLAASRMGAFDRRTAAASMSFDDIHRKLMEQLEDRHGTDCWLVEA